MFSNVDPVLQTKNTLPKKVHYDLSEVNIENENDSWANRPSSGIKWNPIYFKSLPGVLKSISLVSYFFYHGIIQ